MVWFFKKKKGLEYDIKKVLDDEAQIYHLLELILRDLEHLKSEAGYITKEYKDHNFASRIDSIKHSVLFTLQVTIQNIKLLRKDKKMTDQARRKIRSALGYVQELKASDPTDKHLAWIEKELNEVAELE